METYDLNNNFHKLTYKWNLWGHLPHDNDWSQKSYKLIYKFQNIEEIITVLDYLPDALIKNCMLFIMKDGIYPMWEDPKNRNGGCFSYKIINKYVIDVWKDLSFSLVGENLSSNNNFNKYITGISISPKKNFCIIKIWTSNCDFQNPNIIDINIKNLIMQGCLFKKHNPTF